MDEPAHQADQGYAEGEHREPDEARRPTPGVARPSRCRVAVRATPEPTRDAAALPAGQQLEAEQDQAERDQHQRQQGGAPGR